VFRALCVALALAMTPAGASAQAASGQQLPAGWEFVEVMDWVYVGRTDSALDFVMLARQPLHIWVRRELKVARTTGTRSIRMLVQADCGAGRTRIVSSVYFSSSNLEVHNGSDDETQPWDYPAPGTIGEIPLNILCD
jgi:hypothetical protein